MSYVMGLKVSCLMPVKNASSYILDSLEGIVNQSYPVLEIVVVDDSSTDSTHQLALEFSKLHSNVVVLRNPGVGIVDALNYGVSACRGEWIARFDVDDKYVPSRISKQVQGLTSNAAVIFTDYEFVSPKLLSLGVIPSPIFSEAVRLSLLQGRRTAHSSALFSREVFYLSGGYKRDHLFAEDLSLWLRMSSWGELLSVPEVLLKYSLSQNSLSSLNREKMVAMRRMLNQEYRMTEAQILGLIDSQSDLLACYENVSLASERQLLLQLELLKALRLFGGLRQIHQQISRIYKEIDRFWFSALGHLSADTILRRAYRKSSIFANLYTTLHHK